MLAAVGALLAALAVALAAYAAHGVHGEDQARLQLLAAVVFGHGLALAALAPSAVGGLARLPLWGLLLGTLLFGGGIVAGVLVGTGNGLAPIGGTLLILAWLGRAVLALRS